MTDASPAPFSQHDLVCDLARLNEALLGRWPLQPPAGLTLDGLRSWWAALHAMHGTDAGNYFDQRAMLCRLYLEVLQMRLFGPLRDNVRFENALSMLSDVKSRAQFMREAVSLGYHASTVNTALALENPQPSARDRVGLRDQRRRPLIDPSLSCPLTTLFQALRNEQLKQEIEALHRSEGFAIHTYDWGMVIDSPHTKMVFSWDLMCSGDPGLAQRLFTDWALYGQRDGRLEVLCCEQRELGEPVILNCTTSDARTVFIQFEVLSSLPSAQAFGRWFSEVYLPDLFPAQCERAMDTAFEYPLMVFDR